MRVGAIKQFFAAKSGSTAVMFAVTLPTLIAVGGFATDYTSMSSSQNRLQQIVDGAALAVAREMTLSRVTDLRAKNIVTRYVNANTVGIKFRITTEAGLVENNLAVRVEGSQPFATPFGLFEKFIGISQLTAVAIARPAGVAEQMKLCVLALAETANSSVNLRNGSRLTANGCMLHTNSTNRRAVTIGEGSTLKATTVCARGGIQNIGSSVESNLITDCPDMKDPLASKPEPKPEALCRSAPARLNRGTLTLDPGTYCGGMQISGTAQVKFNPGVYVFRDGPLRVMNDAEIHGEGVTLAFTGANAYFRFENNALINMSAPVSGDTAGILIWELQGPSFSMASTGSSGTAVAMASSRSPKMARSSSTSTETPAKITNQHRIASDRAKNLTGTIYLKRGVLTVDATKPVADQSPFTIFVVDRLDLFDGPHLVLNSNYANSPVPVPMGLGPTGNQKVHLGK
jgi:hypothetical protein